MSYDFAGWVTRNDILCSDGVIIRKDAFIDNDNKKVPLVWQHNHSDPGNVLGYVVLQNKNEGVYGQGYLNDTPQAHDAKELIKHGDIVSMSIGANKIKKQNGRDVIHGNIYEVSLVLAGANPGALIDTVITHSDSDESEAIIYTDEIIHASDYEDEENKEEESSNMDEQQMAKELLSALSEDERGELADFIEEVTDGDPENLDDDAQQAITDYIEDLLAGEDEEDDEEDEDYEEEDDVRHNVFSGDYEEDDILEHSQLQADILSDAKTIGSLRESMIQHGINNIEELLTVETFSGAPGLIRPEETSMVDSILSAVKSTPKHTIRGRWADITNKEARAKGYVKGAEKFEESFGHWNRETHPQTIYKKQSLENDDIIDITDWDVVAWLRAEMRDMWRYELARAIFIPDGREPTDPDKIKEDKIRPITTDVSAFVTQVTGVTAKTFIEDVLTNKVGNYKGTGRPDMYMDENLLVQIQLLKDDTGKYLFGDILSRESLASKLGVGKIVTPEFLDNTGKAIMVNLKDYELAAPAKGKGQTHEDFDIDFNKHKYLIEGRVAGALNTPKAAIVFSTGE